MFETVIRQTLEQLNAPFAAVDAKLVNTVARECVEAIAEDTQ